MQSLFFCTVWVSGGGQCSGSAAEFHSAGGRPSGRPRKSLCDFAEPPAVHRKLKILPMPTENYSRIVIFHINPTTDMHLNSAFLIQHTCSGVCKHFKPLKQQSIKGLNSAVTL